MNRMERVMPALVAGIHAFLRPPLYPPPQAEEGGGDVDGRDKPGHDSGEVGRMSNRRQRLPGLLVEAGIAAAGGMAIVAIFAPRIAAAGWLVAFVLWSQIPLGSLMLMMIHRLTGGRWGEALYPTFARAARLVPLLFLLIVPVFIAIPVLDPWSHRAGNVKPDVLSYYLNTPFFIGRSLIAIAGWSVLAFLVPRAAGRPGQLVAAVGLVFHCVVISAVSVDWVLSLEPPFISSSFGASMAITQLIAALAWAALRARQAADSSITGDVGGLLLAFVLGITYVDFMAFLVMWYSDLPSRLFWFVQRDAWAPLAAGAFVLGSVVPILALLLARVRNGIGELRAVAISVLAGLALYYTYLIVPPFGARALGSAALALIAIGVLVAALTGRSISAPSRPSPAPLPNPPPQAGEGRTGEGREGAGELSVAHDSDAQAPLEPAGVSLWPVLFGALASVVLMLAAIWGLSAVYHWQVPHRTLPAPEQFPSPRVQTHQAEELQDLLSAQRRKLTGYEWADQSKTLVRIPVERAMDIIAQRGGEAYAPLLPPGPATADPTAGAQRATTGQAPSSGTYRPEEKP
jgi:hypothetical protein